MKLPDDEKSLSHNGSNYDGGLSAARYSTARYSSFHHRTPSNLGIGKTMIRLARPFRFAKLGKALEIFSERTGEAAKIIVRLLLRRSVIQILLV